MLQNPKSKTSARQCHGHVRLDTVSDGTNSASYTYLANSPLISQISFAQTGAGRMVTTKQYDFLNRLTNIVSATNGTAIATFAYANNSANQRTSVTNFDGTFWSYTYDSLGQVTSGKRYWPDGTPVDGQQFEYSFDDIGNRISTGGRASAASTYTRTSTNAYTQRTVAGVVDVLGIANPTASVTVNGNTANRRGEYFAYPLTVANSSAVYQSVTNTSSYGSGQTVIGKVYVPASTETFTHDQDGNLTGDGRWAYSWDGENRLIQMIRDTDSPSGAREKLVFDYDWMGRRIRKRFYTYSSGWVLSTDTIFLYDGWNLICEFDASSSQPGSLIRSYIWGTDLSGGMQGAGGVGGLLKVTDYVGGTTHSFVAYDGNGNIAALVDGGTGAVNARYEYGPFAEPVRTVGAMGKKLAMRFSTKYSDNESGLIYYGYRYYNPSTGRWISRDPIGTRGGLNSYGWNDNGPVSRIDATGLQVFRNPFSCGCICQDVTVTGFPVPPPDLGWYRDTWRSPGDPVFDVFGNRMTIVWSVVGDPRKCKYGQPESGHLSRTPIPPTYGVPRIKTGFTGVPDISKNEATPITYGANTATYYDPLGIRFHPPFTNNPGEAGRWDIDIDVNITFECTSTDGTKMGRTMHIVYFGVIMVGAETPPDVPP